jgi:hemerythrin-like domain-containing protein
LTNEEHGKLKTIFDNRDSTITMLAQRDQASTERLTDIYVTYQQSVAQTLSVSPSVAPTVSTSPVSSPVSSSPASPPTQPTQ